MKNNRLEIHLTRDHRGYGSTLFTGRQEGKRVRVELGLDAKDSDNYEYAVFIPKGTTSINASFFLGLFFPSIKHLNSIDLFKKKYLISLIQVENELRPYLERNLNECYRKADNEINNSTGID